MFSCFKTKPRKELQGVKQSIKTCGWLSENSVKYRCKCNLLIIDSVLLIKNKLIQFVC